MQQASPSVEELFFAALEIEGSEARSAFLDRHCGDSELRRRVEELLAGDAQGSGFLERPPAPPTLTVESPSLSEHPGTVIGPYTLREPLGEGGMGVVYVAEQTRPVRRKVALKIIKRGMDTKQVIARFEAERQALAMMDHPNIAKVLDGGTTDTGRLYFVMELVRGIPITEYCDREQLCIPERLELFVLVCRAVQHAHQKGVIHRDLKPSNVLATVIDGAPVPKVIDFGVAKATGASLTERTLYTAFHQLVGTPLYMSPEQADLAGVDVDTRSDIYSLGVLLYELLTGTTPIDQDTFRTAAFDELRRIIREQEPPKPSTRLSTLGATRATVSAHRKADARQLDRSVRGELDWIVMKALEKDRNRRYETANNFAADVMRYLTDRPVEACPPSTWYRLLKYARRNRAALTTATVLVTALVAGTAASIWQAVRATRAEARAERRAGETQLVVDYLVNDVFGAAAPEKARGRTVTVNDLLAAGEKLIPARFGRQPLVEAAAREALGRAYYDLGRYDEAAGQLRRVAELRARLLGQDHPDTVAAEFLVVRALCPPAVVLVSNVDKAEPVARRLLETCERTLGPAQPHTFSSMTALAHVLQVKQAKFFLEEARQYPSGLLPTEVLRSKGPAALREARDLLERSYAGQVRRLGAADLETLETLDELGEVLHLEGDFAGAETALRQASEGRSRVLGPAHPDTLRSRKYLGSTLFRLGRTDEAIRLWLDVVDGHCQTFGPTHIQTSSALSYLLNAFRETNNWVAIRELYERLIREILASPIDPDPYQRSRRSITLGGLALRLTTLPAPVLFDAELAVRATKEAAAVDTGWYGWTMHGMVLCRTGQLDEALQALRTATLQPNWTGGNDLYWFALSVAHARRGNLAQAGECFERGRAPDTKRDSWTEIVDNFRAEAAGLLGVGQDARPELKDQPSKGGDEPE
jgi:serine/threonine protein kinase